MREGGGEGFHPSPGVDWRHRAMLLVTPRILSVLPVPSEVRCRWCCWAAGVVVGVGAGSVACVGAGVGGRVPSVGWWPGIMRSTASLSYPWSKRYRSLYVHLHLCFTFRAFIRCFYPKELTISTFVRRISLSVQ